MVDAGKRIRVILTSHQALIIKRCGTLCIKSKWKYSNQCSWGQTFQPFELHFFPFELNVCDMIVEQNPGFGPKAKPKVLLLAKPLELQYHFAPVFKGSEVIKRVVRPLPPSGTATWDQWLYIQRRESIDSNISHRMLTLSKKGGPPTQGKESCFEDWSQSLKWGADIESFQSQMSFFFRCSHRRCLKKHFWTEYNVRA